MKAYIGERLPSGRVRIVVQDAETGARRPLRHVVRHSPTGMEWGYAGSGPADLALSILHDFGGPEATGRYQLFKFAFVARLPRDGSWRLEGQDIQTWLGNRPEREEAAVPFQVLGAQEPA